MRQVTELSFGPQQKSSLLLIAFAGDVFISNEVQADQPTPASKIELPSCRQSRLFDDIFGSAPVSKFDTSATTGISRRLQTKNGLALNKALDPAAHLLPPVHLIWRDLMPLPKALAVEAPNSNIQEADESMQDVEEVEMEVAPALMSAVQTTPAGLIASILK